MGEQTVYAIGDIHGMAAALRGLLDQVEKDAAERGCERARVIFLGDYVDRGARSKGVLDLLASGEIEARFRPTFLLGNHDLCMLQVVRDAEHEKYDHALISNWFANGGEETVGSYGVEIVGRSRKRFLKDLAEAVPKEHVRFLGDLGLIGMMDGTVFCHAGIDPAKPIDQQPMEILLYGDKAFLSWTGDPMPNGVRRVVHGHWTTEEAIVTPWRIGIDTGSGFPRGRLSAVAITGDDVRVLQVEN